MRTPDAKACSIPMLRFSVAERGALLFVYRRSVTFPMATTGKVVLPPLLDSLAWSGHTRLVTGRLFCVMDAFVRICYSS